MTPEAKIWIILKKINDALSIAPKGKVVYVDTKDIEKSVKPLEQEQIFDKLSKDYKLFKITNKPNYKDSFQYSLVIKDVGRFQKALNDSHINHFGSIEMLSGDNFFAVVDVSADIIEDLQLQSTNVAKIPLQRSLIRFLSLCPANYPNFRDRYCDLRWKALEYLKNNKKIGGFYIVDNYGLHRWEKEISVTVDRTIFTNFYEKLMKVYKKRVKFTNKEEESKTTSTLPSPPTQKIEITAMPDLNIKNTDKNVIIKNNKRITLLHFPRTDWASVSIKFTDNQNILMSDGKDVKPATFEGLGCADGRNNSPDDTWGFLLSLALGNGLTSPISKKEREKRKKQKQKITDILRKIFQNDTDPFEIESGGVYKSKFKIEPPAQNDIIQVDKKYADAGSFFDEFTQSGDEI